MTREEAHELVDKIFDIERVDEAVERVASQPLEAELVEEQAERVLPEGKRVVRTKSSGDRVYYLDEVKKTRQWIYNPEVLDSLGFTMADVTDIEDIELLKYNMGAAILKPLENVTE